MLKMFGKTSILLLLFVAACSGRASCFGRTDRSKVDVEAEADAAALLEPDAAVLAPLPDGAVLPEADAGDCPE